MSKIGNTKHIKKIAAAVLISLFSSSHAADVDLLNVSYDPTREFYQEYNERFAHHWLDKTGDKVRIRMSHGGSGRQALAVMQGLNADIVSLALAYDIDMVAERTGRLATDWQTQLPFASSPYTSTIVFLVREGNPKKIQDWDDLIREDIGIITPNPKTSGGARWNYLAAWGHAYLNALGSLDSLKPTDETDLAAAEQTARDFVAKLYNNVLMMDTGARGSSVTFVERGLGDVLIAWENEALLSLNRLNHSGLEIVYPSQSILAEPPVTVVTGNTDPKGTTEVARAYVEHLYSEEGQALAAKHYYRPQHTEKIEPEYLAHFQPVELFRLDALYPNWSVAQEKHFSNGGVFDQITRK